MKKSGFKRKIWQSWLIIILYVGATVAVFRAIDARSHSASDTLINFAPRFLILTVALYVICRWKERKRVKGAAGVLLRGGIAVILTDTTYGIVGSAFNEKVVNEIYRLRKRDLNKPFIILIADKSDLKKFGVVPTEAQNKILDRVWPGPTSVILPCTGEKFSYLHRGKNTLAFRCPSERELRALLHKVGPLVAPSANPQGLPVARTIAEARAYFGHHARPVRGREGSQCVFDSNGVNFYQDGGAATAPPSRLIDVTDGTEKMLRS